MRLFSYYLIYLSDSKKYLFNSNQIYDNIQEYTLLIRNFINSKLEINLISVVLPTYNEKENIAILISDIFDVYKKNNIEGNIIVVDDNSPDGTREIIEDIINTRNDRNVILINRAQKLGLGSAYIEGFKKAISLGSEYIFEMDADLSHCPQDIPKFISATQINDLVLGSRYINGGKIENWNCLRKIISKGGAIYAKTILDLPINDLTSGYKCFKSEVLKSIDLSKIKSDGYSFQIELTYHAFKKGYNIVEIPIIFKDRKNGSSKFSKSIFWEAIMMVWRLKLKYR